MPYDPNVGWILRTGDEYTALLQEAHDARRAARGLSPVDYTEDTVFGMIFDAVSLQLGSLDEGVQQVWESRSPLSATGESLTDLAAITGIAGRLPATYSTARTNFLGTIGTLIPAGLVIRDSLRQDWLVTADATLVAPGAVTVILRAAQPGIVNAALNTITIPQTAIAGLNVVTNIEPAAPGRPVETDPQLRQRTTDLISLGGSDTVGALRAACLFVDDVQQCEVLNNRSSSIVTQYGHTLQPHSLSVFIYPAISGAQEERLADAILGYSPGGIQQNGTSTLQRPVPDTDPVEYTDVNMLKWTYQVAEDVDVDVIVELATGYSLAQVTPEIQQAIVTYQATLLEERIQARKIRRLSLLGIIANIAGICAADVLLDGLNADVTLDIEKYPSLVLQTITEGTP